MLPAQLNITQALARNTSLQFCSNLTFHASSVPFLKWAIPVKGVQMHIASHTVYCALTHCQPCRLSRICRGAGAHWQGFQENVPSPGRSLKP